MPVITLPFGALEANCHIVHNGTDAVVFDPSDDTAAVLDILARKNLTLRAIALTHLHVDHCLGCADLSKATGLIPVIGLEDWLQRSMLIGKGMCFGMDLKPFQAEPLEEGEITWGSLNCKVIHTPGHSPGSLCYYFEDLGVLITGDLLFFRSVGRSDLPFGDGEALVRSLREKIYTLPGATLVYPGHGPETSVSFEAVHNHFCRA
jgi:glyoxylase-like metal-dependent hydrolase (beta-lactamase superfamily II)